MQLTNTEYTMLVLQLPRTGVASYWRLLEHFSNIKAALNAPLSQLAPLIHKDALTVLQAIKSDTAHPIVVQIKRDIDYIEHTGITLLDIDDERYPQLLRDIARPPPLLYVWGDANLLDMPQIAIVGSRNPTPNGQANARHFGQALSQAGFTITSGLALGIDIAAHEGATDHDGRTIAVLGTGIDQIYPARHRATAENIVAKGGAIVSEFPLRTKALPRNFPQRNRIVSGLSCGVLVVEAALKSGSLITARYALQQNREVFAIPRAIQNPLSRGCHALIREGATLVEGVQDIVTELGGLLAYKQASLELDILENHNVLQDIQDTENSNEGAVLQKLDYNPQSFDQIAQYTGLCAGELMACLVTMEMKGLVANHGNSYSKALNH